MCLEPIQDIVNSLASCIYHESDDGVSSRASLGSEATADLAMDDQITQ